jgi:hypothetical protein
MKLLFSNLVSERKGDKKMLTPNIIGWIILIIIMFWEFHDYRKLKKKK